MITTSLDALFAEPELLRVPQNAELYTKKNGSSDTNNEDDDI